MFILQVNSIILLLINVVKSNKNPIRAEVMLDVN